MGEGGRGIAGELKECGSGEVGKGLEELEEGFRGSWERGWVGEGWRGQKVVTRMVALVTAWYEGWQQCSSSSSPWGAGTGHTARHVREGQHRVKAGPTVNSKQGS